MPDAAHPRNNPYASLSDAAAPGPQRRLSLFDAICIIVGCIIGAGIFETVGAVAGAAGSHPKAMLLWLAGGAVSLVGALCFAELATAYPREGGEYVFLTRAFGPRVGFLFAWAGFWVVRPGSIGAMAYVFGNALGPMTARYDPLTLVTSVHPTLAAAAAVIATTLINMLGVRTGTRGQNLLTAAKVLGIGAVVVAGLCFAPQPAFSRSLLPQSADGARLALILVLFTYGGWNEIAYVAAEVRDPARQIARALVFGVVAVTAIYLLFGHAAGALTLVSRDATPGTWEGGLVGLLGPAGGTFVGALVCLSSFGAVHGMTLAGSRIYYAVGTDHPAYRWLGRWDPRGGGAPVRSLLAQGAVTVALVVGFGLYDDGFRRMVVFTTPIFWGFFLLAAVSLFVLRTRDRHIARPFRVPLYPLTPALFAASCAFMLWSSLTYAWDNRRWEALWAIGLLLAGVVVSVLTARQRPDGGGGGINARGFEVVQQHEGGPQ